VKSTRDVAILYRTNAQSRPIEDVFRAFGLAYQVVGGVSFYQRREVKDVLAYMRLLRTPQDSVALARVLNVPPRGIGDKTRTSLLAFAQAEAITTAEALLRGEEIVDVPQQRQRAALAAFGRLLARLRDDLLEREL